MSEPVQTDQKPIMRVGEAAKMLGVSRYTMSAWLKAGKLSKIEGTQFISRAEVDRFAGVLATPKTPEERRRGPRKKGR